MVIRIQPDARHLHQRPVDEVEQRPVVLVGDLSNTRLPFGCRQFRKVNKRQFLQTLGMDETVARRLPKLLCATNHAGPPNPGGILEAFRHAGPSEANHNHFIVSARSIVSQT